MSERFGSKKVAAGGIATSAPHARREED